MELYTKEINKLKELFSHRPLLQISSDKSWPKAPSEEIILKSDTAFELGGNTADAISGILFTTSKTLVPSNQVYVSGMELNEINSLAESEKENINYSRFVIVCLKDSAIQNKTSQQLYGIFRKLDYIRFHAFIKGFALRISSVQHREVVRVSKEAIQNGITLSQVGNSFINAYCELPEVEAVHIYFTTSPQKDSIFKELNQTSKKAYEITESLNEIFQGLKMDCSTCSQKAICDEIEGMKELHQNLK